MIVRATAVALAILGLARTASAAPAPGESPALRAFAADLDECVGALRALDRNIPAQDRLSRCLPTLVSYKALETRGKGVTGVFLPDASTINISQSELKGMPRGLRERTLWLYSLLEERLGPDALRPNDPSLFTQSYDVPSARVQSWKFARAQARLRGKNTSAWRDLAGPGADAGALDAFLREFLPTRLDVLWRRAGTRVDPNLAWISGEMASDAVAGAFSTPPPNAERVVREAPELWSLIAARLEPSSHADLPPLAPQAQIVLAETVAAMAAVSIGQAAAGGRFDLAGVRAAAAVWNKPFPKPAVSTAPVYFEPVDAKAAGFAFAAAESPFEDTGVDQMPGGMAALDYDLDGRPDLLLCAPGQARLMRNLGGFRFDDVTAAAGLTGAVCRNGASSADFDNDGRPDLLLLHGVGDRDHLYRNEGGRFKDVTAAMGLPSAPAQTTSAVWFDYDGDGRLDLYLVEYGDLMFARDPPPDISRDGFANRLYRNAGGRFTDVTAAAGVGDTAWGLGAAAFDYDGDADLFVLNDFGRSSLYRNDGGGKFTDASKAAGVDFAGNGMGVSVADFDHDGRPDLFVTYIGDERPVARLLFPAAAPAVRTRSSSEIFPIVQRNRLLRNAGDGTFVDVTTTTVDGTATGWGWNGMFLDAGNRGELDLYLVNGWWAYRPFYDRETKVFWRYEPESKRFVERSDASGASFAGNSRVSVAADLDGDGCLDLVVAGFHPLRVFRGRCPASNHWLELKLEGAASNRDGIGARVAVTAGGVTQTSELGPQGGGFQNSQERVVRFGLGASSAADAVEISWPSGTKQSLGQTKADRRLVVREAAGEKK